MLEFLLLAQAAEEESSGGLIDVVPGLMIWTLICFGITFYVLKRFAFARIQQGIDERRERIRKAVEEADRAREEAHRLLEQHRAGPLLADVLPPDAPEIAEAPPAQDGPRAEGRQPRPRARQRLGVPVDPEHAHPGRGAGQHRFRVPSHPHRPVDHPARAPRAQEEHHLVPQDRDVNPWYCASRAR